MTETQVTLRGVVVRVFHSSPEFSAGVLKTETGQSSFAGNCFAAVGDKMEIHGEWVDHPRFGRQLKVATGVAKMDESPEALTHLLATDRRFKGLGPARARQVVEAACSFSGGDLGEALRDYAREISDASGVALEIVENARDVWNSKRSFFDAIAALVGQGWTNGQASRIVAVLGENAAAIIADDPYGLIPLMPRFGFRTVDVVARKMGVPANDPARMRAGVAYSLDTIGDNGNTWTTRTGLIEQAKQELRPDSLEGERMIPTALQELIDAGMVYVDTSPNDREVVASAALAQCEFSVFELLLRGLGAEARSRISIDGPRSKAILETLNDGQRAAVMGVVSRPIAVLSGGAGVGKTYTTESVCEIMEENGYVVELCAPTGKAARKLAHATKREAKTIHRLLEPMFDERTGRFSFRRGREHPIEADLVVVDEVSMADVRLMLSLLLALPAHCRLLLVGDHHQIPSVSPGAILRDLLAARDRYPDAVHVLTEIVRQAGELARNTSAILSGIVSAKTSDAWAIQSTEKGNEEGAAAIAATIVEYVATPDEPLEPFGRFLDFEWDVQVLSPQKKGPLGTFALNVHLQRLRQRLLGNPEPEKTPTDRPPKPLVGDRVIWTKNDYKLDIFNGTQAIVVELLKGGGMVLFTEDGEEKTIEPAKRKFVEVAYAMTIHKSQGSEWPCVLLIASSAHWYMHDRNLLYTGASRASESLTILGDKSGIRHFASERKSAQRQTFGAFLVHGWEPKAQQQPVVVPAADTTSG